MKPKPKPNKSAARQPKTRILNVNIEYLEEVAADAISTIDALAALVKQLSAQLEEGRNNDN
jgi:hypothetical protein